MEEGTQERALRVRGDRDRGGLRGHSGFPLGAEVLLQARRFHLPCPSQALQCSLMGAGDTGDTGDCPGVRV